jgi:hypothetical protein
VIRALLTIACLAVLALAVWGLRVGWRHRAGRQSDLPPLPRRPAQPGAVLAQAETGLYVGTTYASSWQDRVVAQGLGARAAAALRVYPSGVAFDREGAELIFVPATAVVEARLAPGLAGKVVGAGGLFVVRWRLGEQVLDSGFRADDKAAYPALVRAVNELAEVAHAAADSAPVEREEVQR